MTRIAKTGVHIGIFASSVLQVCSFLYTRDNSDGLVSMLHSAVCGYSQVYKHQDMLQKVGVALCMPNARALPNSIPT